MMAIKKVVVTGEELCIFGEDALDAGVDITPGMLIERASSTEVAPNSTAADTSPQRMFADERLQVLTGGDIDTDYANDGDAVSWVIPPRGAKIYAWLSAGENVAFDAILESDGAGALQAVTTGEVVARAAEAVNNGAGGTAVRILVEVQ